MYRSRHVSILACAVFLIVATACSDGMLTSHESEGTGIVSSEARTLAAPDARSPVRLTFDKTAISETEWSGTVAGDIEGSLTTTLLDARETGTVLQVDFEWDIDADDDDFSFVAHLSGILNLNTGRVVMNGRVVDGYLEGARVHEEGQLVDPETFRFEGIINILPATAR